MAIQIDGTGYCDLCEKDFRIIVKLEENITGIIIECEACREELDDKS